MTDVNQDFLKHIRNPGPGLCDKSRVEYVCSCGTAVPCVLKQLKHKVRKGKPLRCRSCVIKGLWDRPGFRDKISQENIWSDSDLRQRMSEKSERLWKDPEYVRKQKVAHVNPEYLEETRDRSRRLWDNVGFRARQREIRSNPEWIQRQSESLRAVWRNPEYQDKVASSLAKVFVNGFRSSIEATTASDFLFSDVSIMKLDAKLKRKGHRSAAQEFLDSYHYAQFGRSSKTVYGAFLGDELVAVCKFSPPVRKEVATSLGYNPSQTFELDRFCIHPGYQKKNFASWMLSRCARRAFDEFGDVLCLISFADQTHGHAGTIYRASNWTEHGTVPPDYHYVNEDGWVIHKKTLYNHASRNCMKESEYARAYGYEKAYGKSKTKFIMKRRVTASSMSGTPHG